MLFGRWIGANPVFVFDGDDGGGNGGGGDGGGDGGNGGSGAGGGAGSGGDGDQRVPLDRFQSQVDARKAAEKRAEEAEAKLKEAEEADLSEKQRAERERDEAAKRAEAAEAEVQRLTRSGWARDAATDANFIDPSDAVAHLNLTDLDTEAKVKNAVGKLAEEKKHLVRDKPAGGFGQPSGGDGGGADGGGGDDGDVPTGDDGKADHELGLGQDLARNLGIGRR